MPSQNPLPKIVDVSIERAYEIIGGISNPSKHEGNPITVYSGEHPEYGSVYVSIPPLGDATLLPIVVQRFD